MSELLSPDEMARLQRIEALAVKLDAAWRIPVLGIHVGWDPLISFVPFVGDMIMALVGMRIVTDAARLGSGQRLIMRMYANVAADLLLGMIPFAGPVIDVVFRSNIMNLKLLLDDLDRRRTQHAASV
jgi:hypothetical protein